MSLLNFLSCTLQRLKQKITPAKRGVIIVGVEYDCYQIHKIISSSKSFFIDEEPWSHRNVIGEAQLRYPVELRALCQNYTIADSPPKYWW